MRSRSLIFKCSRVRKPPSPCPKPTGKGETLADLIQEFMDEVADRQRSHRDQYRNFASLTEAVKHAMGVVGKVPDHQRRVGREVLQEACKRLLLYTDEIQACKSFAKLLDLVEQYTANIQRFGRLAVYDTANRLGIYLHLDPEVVYLHAGTQKGAKALDLDTGRGYLAMDELPEPFRRLEPWECEDFLCIYEARLAKLNRKA